ncbi:MAG: class I SAM-dependent methyltransferase, partial [Pseudonocardiaceae bacterium]
MTDTVNHHADHPGFAGVTGLLAGLTMILGRGAVARLTADLAAVSDADRVVDVGCGPGAAVREAARRGARVTGVDPAPVMLRLARTLTRNRPAITWADGTAEDLPLPDGSATVLWSVATVHHWTDVTAGLAEA